MPNEKVNDAPEIKQPEASVTFEKEEMTEQEKQEFLNSCPTRAEVANFVGAYMSNEVLPQLLEYTNARTNRNLGLISVCQAVLVAQGIISQEDMNALIANWEANQAQKPTTPPGVVK